MIDEKGTDVPVHTSDNKDGTFTIQYEPTSVGTYTASVFFADKEIPSSPFKVEVEPHIDISQVYVDRLEPSKFWMMSFYSFLNNYYEVKALVFVGPKF